VVNLTWNATDPLGRDLLFTLYVNATGGDPLRGPPMVVNATTPWFVIELEEGSHVSWAVEAMPVDGPVSVLGTASFTVEGVSTVAPVAVLSVDGNLPGTPSQVEALSPLVLDGNASYSSVAGDLEYMFDFGDGTASGWVTSSSVEHTYLTEGRFNASLSVRLVDGPGSEPALVVVTVLPGDKTSPDEVPGAGGAMGAMAMMVACLVLMVMDRTRKRGGGKG
jgi:hypothetical protein